MKKSDIKDLKHGLYKIYWKKKHGGGTSFASVGNCPDGTRWFAPTNWIHVPGLFVYHYKKIKKLNRVI